MADISKIKTPNGNEYNIKDTTCRSDISDLTTSVSGLQSRVTTIENDGLVEITTSEIDDIIETTSSGGGSGGSGGNYQAKTGITPTESSQRILPGSGYDALSSVQINAISSSYVGSGVSTQAAQTIHPSTTDQTIASGKYLTGVQTIKGVTLSNLSAGNIKSGVVVKVGDSTDDDCVTSVTGSYTGESASIGTKTLTNSDNTLTSISFTGLSGTPKMFVVRCTSQLTRSSSYSYYYITAVRYNGTNTYGNYWRMSNGTFYNDTSHYSYTYSGGTLTITSSAGRGSAGGSFYNGGYELVYVY